MECDEFSSSQFLDRPEYEMNWSDFTEAVKYTSALCTHF